MNTRYLLDKQFKTTTGVTFTILGVESYPKSKVSERYKGILDFKPGFLVAIPYRTALIPNITLEEGVARITKIVVNGETIKTAHAISTAIGVVEAMTAYSIKELN